MLWAKEAGVWADAAMQGKLSVQVLVSEPHVCRLCPCNALWLVKPGYVVPPYRVGKEKRSVILRMREGMLQWAVGFYPGLWDLSRVFLLRFISRNRHFIPRDRN